MRIAAIGDIHANAGALEAALATADEGGYDRLVLLGDLLTYGADVLETLDLVGDRLADERTVLLRGNHDALYRDLMDGTVSSGLPMADWVAESVMWTLDRLPPDQWSALSFEDEYELQGLLFSHANPFGPEHWGYLNSVADHTRAVEKLSERGFWGGVFGHTHRAKWYRYLGESGSFQPCTTGKLDQPALHVLNTGAIGQPRDTANPAPHVLWLTVSDEVGSEASFYMQRFSYDVAGHIDRVGASGMSVEALRNMTSFFPDTVSKEPG